ncbi:MAG: hypothetical protein OXI64_04710 [Defluviicoccus sp.]|nr:hypothetical protein [Defluviicoccus sp.]
MKLDNKPRLRSALKKLYAAKIDWADNYVRGTAGQEAIDFVTMMAGLKPVYVSGRGFDHEGWHAAVLELAASNGLYVVAGPYWEARRSSPDLPDWFAERMRKGLTEGRAHYVTKARATADELRELGDGARPTVEQEARLLGFPVCCVEAHYAGVAAFEGAAFEMLSRRADGDEEAIRRLVEGDEPVRPETDEERALLSGAMSVNPARNTSLNMCEKCAVDPESPGAKLSATYGELMNALTGNRGRNPARRRRG